MVKNLLANARDVRGLGAIPGSGRSPRGGRDKPLQCFSPWTKEPGGLQSLGSQSWTPLKQLSMQKLRIVNEN